jgi:hypothetical protein
VVFDGSPTGKANEFFFRWTYTAVTRASQNLHLVNAPDFSATDAIHWADDQVPQVLQQPEKIAEVSGRTLAEQLEFLLKPADVQLNSLQSMPYRYRLNLSRDAIACRVDLVYNKKRITRAIEVRPPAIPGPGADTLVEDIKRVLKPLEDHLLPDEKSVESKSAQIPEFPKDKPHLEQLYQQLTTSLKPHQIRILSVEHLNWMERYRFSSGSEQTQIDFSYNAKGRFTRAQTVGGMDTPLSIKIRNAWQNGAET